MTVALFASVAALVAAVVLARWLWELDRLDSRQREQAAEVAARHDPHACMVDDTDPFGLDRPPSPVDMAVAGAIIAVFLSAVALVALEFVRVVWP